MQQWYKDGLAFECTGCGRCCGGGPGVVWVDRKEIELIAAKIEVSHEQMWGKFIRRVPGNRVSLTEQPNGDCVFLRRNSDGSRSCVIYDIRPQQCRTWPFWGQNLRSLSIWNFTTHNCPGINRGQRYRLEQIEAIRQAQPWHQLPEDQRREVTR